MNKEEWEDYKKLSGEITDKLDNTATYESWLIIQEYVDRCQEKNQKCKEVIDKANKYINDNLIISSILDGKKYYTLNNYSFDYRELLEILDDKEVE